MGSLGMQEIVVIFVLALIIFGPRKLPDIGKTLGKGMAEFKKASNELKRTWEEEVELEKGKEVMSSVLKETTDLKETWEDEFSYEGGYDALEAGDSSSEKKADPVETGTKPATTPVTSPGTDPGTKNE